MFYSSGQVSQRGGGGGGGDGKEAQVLARNAQLCNGWQGRQGRTDFNIKLSKTLHIYE
jgi:hypothetical protein